MKIVIIAASAAAVVFGGTVLVNQQTPKAPTPETASRQIDTKSGQEMRPRWDTTGGQGDGASN